MDKASLNEINSVRASSDKNKKIKVSSGKNRGYPYCFQGGRGNNCLKSFLLF